MTERVIKLLLGIGLITTGLVITLYKSYRNKNEIDKHKEIARYDPYKKYRDFGDFIQGLPVFIGISFLLVGVGFLVSAII